MKNWITLSLMLLLLGSCTSKSEKNLPTEEDMAAYLMVYFSDSDHSLHYALSRDGYEFTALNDNNPVISGDTLAAQHGIRDPYAYRGPDGKFYMVMTDLHIFGKEAGLRETTWERPDEYGWGNNRGIVLMSSDDLVNWKHNEIFIDEAFPEEFKNIGCAWAPQVIYDPSTEKMMVYFTIRKIGENLPESAGTSHDRKTKLYYSYANDDFNMLETIPALLYEYPDTTIQVLDADIYPMPDGRWMMTYVAQENPGGIKVAYSDSIHSGYNYVEEQIDGEDRGCEAPTTWKRIGEDKWVVMYDIYSVQPNNFGFVETSDFKSFTPMGRFNEGPMKTTNFISPKHGSVIHITADEADYLESAYGFSK